MADNDLIGSGVQAGAVSSGVNLETNIPSIQSIGNSLNSAISQVQKSAAFDEKYKRQQNEIAAKSDMASFSAWLSELNTDFKLQLGDAQTDQEMNDIREEYQNQINERVNGANGIGVPYFRNRRGKDIATEYLKRHQSEVNSEVKLRMDYVNQKHSIDNYNYVISQTKKNPLDPNYMAKLRNVYTEMQAMGPDVMTESKAQQLLEVDKQEQIKGVADNATALFQADLDKYAESVNTEIGQLQVRANKDGITQEEIAQINKMANNAMKTYNANVKNRIGLYKDAINQMPLTNVQKRSYLKSVASNATYSMEFMKNIKAQVEDQTKFIQNENLMKFYNWQLDNINKMPTTQQLRSFNISQKDMLAIQKNWIGKKELEEKQKSKKIQDLEDARIESRNNFFTADSIRKSLRAMNPNSPQSEFNSLIEKAIGITDSTYQSIMLKEINQVRDKKQFLNPINDFLKQTTTMFNELFEKDVISGFGDTTEPEDYPMASFITQFNIAQQARRIYAEKGFEASKKYITDSYSELADGVSREVFVSTYYQPIGRTEDYIMEDEQYLIKDKDEEYFENDLGSRYIKNIKTGEKRYIYRAPADKEGLMK